MRRNGLPSFNYCIQGIWYRDSFSLSDDDFERIMNALEGKVPANVKIYHYGVPGRKRYDLSLIHISEPTRH